MKGRIFFITLLLVVLAASFLMPYTSAQEEGDPVAAEPEANDVHRESPPFRADEPVPSSRQGRTPDAVLYYWDFEGTNGGFAGTRDWEWGTYAWAGTCTTHHEPPSAYSGTDMWGTVLNGCYHNLGNNSGYDTCVNGNPTDDSILSFTIDLTGVTDPVEMSWWEWFDVYLDFDWGEVYANGNVVFQHCSTGYVIPTEWEQQVADLTPYIGGLVDIEFHMMANTVAERAGWWIDNVMVYTVVPSPDLTPSFKEAPFWVDPGDPISYTIVLSNSGLLDTVSTLMTDTIPVGTTYIPDSLSCSAGTCWQDGLAVYWNGVVPTSTVVTVDFSVDASDAKCGIPINNTAVISDSSLFLPLEVSADTELRGTGYYSWDFEADDGGFVANAPPGEWEWGTLVPSPDSPSAAHSGTKLWATNLSGDIPLEPSDHYLTRTVDLALDLNGIYLEWWDWWHEDGGDYGRVLVNGTEVYYIEANQLSWERHLVDLSEWAGQTVDIVFYHQATGTGDAGAGWYVDDVSIYGGCAITDLTLAKHAPSRVESGSPLDYVIVVENLGTVPSAGTYLTDTLPMGMTYVPGEAYANYGNLSDDVGHIYWNGTVAMLDPLFITIPVVADAPCGEVVFNNVVLTDPNIDDPLVAASGTEMMGPGYYAWDFEADDGGFVANTPPGEWEWGMPDPEYPGGPTTAHSGVNVWGTDLDDYASDTIGAHLLSKTLTLPADPNGLFLQWWDWYGDEVDDERQIWIDGVEVWNDNGGTDQTYWDYHIVDISDWAGQTVDLDFRLEVSGDNPGPEGWYIDDVAIYGDCYRPYPKIVVDAPPLEAAFCFDATETFTFTICNAGDEPLVWEIREMMDVGFAQDLRYNRFVTFALNDFPGQTVLGTTVGRYYGMDFDPTATILYALNDTTDELGTIDLADGTFTGLVSCPAPVNVWTGLSIDPTTGVFYASDTTDLYTIDPATGVYTQIGPFGTSAMIDIAMGPNGEMYGHDIGTDSIYQIDPTTGAATLVGPTGYDASNAQGMDFDNYDGTLHIFLYIGGGANVYGTVNLTTGAVKPQAINNPLGEFEGATQTGGLRPDVAWLTIVPTNGLLAPDLCEVVDVTFDATGMPPGEYLADPNINSNDPLTPDVTLPATMMVGEAADILDVVYETADLLVAFDALVAGVEPLTYAWDFGDGNTSNLEDPIHTYDDEGCYTVTFTATNACAFDVWSDEVCVVAVCEPVDDLAFTWSPETPVVGESVSFVAAEPLAGTPPFIYTWDFGDGTGDVGQTSNHAYTAAGDYEVTLSVENACGEASIADTVAVEVGMHYIYLPVIANKAAGVGMHHIYLPIVVKNN